MVSDWRDGVALTFQAPHLRPPHPAPFLRQRYASILESFQCLISALQDHESWASGSTSPAAGKTSISTDAATNNLPGIGPTAAFRAVGGFLNNARSGKAVNEETKSHLNATQSRLAEILTDRILGVISTVANGVRELLLDYSSYLRGISSASSALPETSPHFRAIATWLQALLDQARPHTGLLSFRRLWLGLAQCIEREVSTFIVHPDTGPQGQLLLDFSMALQVRHDVEVVTRLFHTQSMALQGDGGLPDPFVTLDEATRLLALPPGRSGIESLKEIEQVIENEDTALMMLASHGIHRLKPRAAIDVMKRRIS